MEKDIGFEPFLVPVAVGLLDQALDLVVQTLHWTVAQVVIEEVQDPLQMGLEHLGDFLHRG